MPPPLSVSDVLACSFPEWYPTFHSISPKATILKDLPPDFRDYLLSDGITLPEGCDLPVESQLSDDEDDNDDESSPSPFSFPELNQRIQDTLKKYGGSVFPKLNWSSPQDAAFMLPGRSLECQSPADIYMLLKASDFVIHDLEHAFDECTDAREGAIEDVPLVLVLKKHFDMPRSQEWRCFVRDKTLIAISQRDSQFYDFMHVDNFATETTEALGAFFETSIRPAFPLDHYTFDVFRSQTGRVFVVDFNPYAQQTDALLFTWDELDERNATRPELRTVAHQGAQSSALPRFSHNQYPKEVVDLSTGESIAEFARKWNETLAEGVLK